MRERKSTEVKPKGFLLGRLEIDKKTFLSSLLAAFAVPFMLLLSPGFSVFFSNAEELRFRVGDFAPAFLLASAAMFLVIFLILLVTKKLLRKLIFSMCAGLVLCAYTQTFITTLTFKGLPGDGNASPSAEWWVIADLVLWAVIFAAVVALGVLLKKSNLGAKLTTFILILVLVMQSVSLVPSAITYVSKASDDSDESTQMYLTTENLMELSTVKNVVVFVVDRFDRDFYLELMEYDSSALDGFDGFTYYDDNITMYPRTYPAVVSMLTGEKTDFSTPRDEYFEYAYSHSEFLDDLKANNFKINLYIPYYYSYKDATVLKDTTSNISRIQGVSIASDWDFTKKMLKLSSYFWLPDKFKSDSISSNAFYESVSFEGDAPEYTIDKATDPGIYTSLISEGLSTQDGENTFTMLHLRGCHNPHTMDENSAYVPEGVTSVQQTLGVFNIIEEYINQMKELGIYEDSTIIITGDHAALSSDSEPYETPELTALLVKESGEYGTALKTSYAQVSQDNLFATVVKSAQIQTDNDYGLAYSEVPENEDIIRIHYFQTTIRGENNDDYFVYEITGKGTDFDNWKLVEHTTINYQ